jgi:hypothetical protein
VLRSPLARRVRALLRALLRPAPWRGVRGRALRRKALAGALAGTLAALTALPQAAHSAPRPAGVRAAVVAAASAGDGLAGGQVLRHAQLRGDGVSGLGAKPQGARRAGRVTVEGDERARPLLAGDGYHALAPQGFGDLMLTGGGVDWRLNTGVVEQTSSASGAFYDAAFAELVPATTASGGLITTTLDDAFDGYKALCVGGDCGCSGPECGTSAVVYGGNGSPLPDTSCLGLDTSAADQYLFGAQTIGQLQVSRKVYIPESDTFARHLEVVTNLSSQPQSADLTLFGNLGSEDGSRVAYDTTVIIATSSGDRVASDEDYWVTTMQAFGPDGSSPDPRLGHILAGPGGQVRAVNVSFADDDEYPAWRYHLELAPGQTATLMSFVTLHSSQAAANARAEELLAVDPAMLQCMSSMERGIVANWHLPVVYIPLIRR